MLPSWLSTRPGGPRRGAGGSGERTGRAVRRSEHDAAAARVLSGGADRDVTEMTAEFGGFREQNTRVLNAMREDLTDLRSRVDHRHAEMRNGFTEMRGKLDAAAGAQQQIVGLLNTLIKGEDR